MNWVFPDAARRIERLENVVEQLKKERAVLEERVDDLMSAADSKHYTKKLEEYEKKHGTEFLFHWDREDPSLATFGCALQTCGLFVRTPQVYGNYADDFPAGYEAAAKLMLKALAERDNSTQ